MLGSDYILQIRELIHDLQSLDWTDSELLSSTNNARKRVALDSHCVRNFYTGGNFIANQEIYPISGGFTGVLMVNAGTGYPLTGTPPVVTAQAPVGGGTTAVGTAVLNGTGGISDVLMTNWGTTYAGTETITIAPPGVGTQATATPVIMSNILDILSIQPIWPGGTNSRMMKWLPFTLFQAWARAYRGNFSYPEGWTSIDQQNIFFVQPIPDQPYAIEVDAIALPVPLAATSTLDTQVLDPFADAVQWYGAYLAMVKLQNLDQADYFRKQYNLRLREIAATRQSRRIPNVYASSFRRMQRW